MDNATVNLDDESFKDEWFYEYYLYGTKHKNIPNDIENALVRKLDILDSINFIKSTG